MGRSARALPTLAKGRKRQELRRRRWRREDIEIAMICRRNADGEQRKTRRRRIGAEEPCSTSEMTVFNLWDGRLGESGESLFKSWSGRSGRVGRGRLEAPVGPANFSQTEPSRAHTAHARRDWHWVTKHQTWLDTGRSQ